MEFGGIEASGKGKAPEKHMCSHCLHKGIECEWDEGGRGESQKKLFFSFFGVSALISNRYLVPAVPQQKNLLHCQRFRSANVKKAMYGGGCNSKTIQKAEVGTCGHSLGPKEAEVYLRVKKNYLF